MLYIFCFVFRILSEYRFHLTPDTWNVEKLLKQQQQQQKNMNSYLKKTPQISLVKNDVLLLSHYVTLATLFDHALPVYTCEMFSFHRHDPRALQICVNLIRNTYPASRKKGGQVCIFSCNHNVWMFNILNEPDCMKQFSCKFCAFLTRGYAKETSLSLSKTWVDYIIKFCVLKNNN